MKPLTFKEWAVKYCFDRGMFEKVAAAVIEQLMQDESSDSMANRWNDTIDGYPPQMLGVLTVAINRIAVKYIEKNCPMAWYKSMFTGVMPDGSPVNPK